VRLYLVRHAEAAPGEPDELRALTSRGRKDAGKLGAKWRDDGVALDAVLASPLLRARETADALARAAGVEAETDERLAPGATADDVRAVVEGRGEAVAVVGHQPDCGQIAAALTGGPEPPFRTAGWLEIDLDA
jgi:phosphohistidine phosphatase SixA